MSEQNPLTINQLIKMLKKLGKQAGDLPVMFYTGEEDIQDNRTTGRIMLRGYLHG